MCKCEFESVLICTCGSKLVLCPVINALVCRGCGCPRLDEIKENEAQEN